MCTIDTPCVERRSTTSRRPGQEGHETSQACGGASVPRPAHRLTRQAGAPRPVPLPAPDAGGSRRVGRRCPRPRHLRHMRPGALSQVSLLLGQARPSPDALPGPRLLAAPTHVSVAIDDLPAWVRPRFSPKSDWQHEHVSCADIGVIAVNTGVTVVWLRLRGRGPWTSPSALGGCRWPRRTSPSRAGRHPRRLASGPLRPQCPAVRPYRSAIRLDHVVRWRTGGRYFGGLSTPWRREIIEDLPVCYWARRP